MPANLTPDYMAAEERYRGARTPQEKLDGLQEMLRLIPKHKGTDHMQADIKRRISKLKKEATKKSVKAVHQLYVKPEGIGQIFVLGPPNAGKSQLLASLTNADVKVEPYPFTTAMYQPGMMRYVDVWVQLVDMPPISAEATMPWIPSVARYGNAALLVLSLASDDLLSEVEFVLDFLEQGKVRLARKGEPTWQFASGVAALETLLVLTHCQDPDAQFRRLLLDEMLPDAFDRVEVDFVAAPDSVDAIRKPIYRLLHRTRVYTKQPGKPPDNGDPFVVREGTTLEKLAHRIHKDIGARLQYARIWNDDPEMFDGQRVARDYVIQEGDVVEIHA
jgi:ribosome-interacting GTPase 1